MEKKEEWVIFEAKGFRTLAGRLSEIERAGVKLFRLEVPLGPPPTDGAPETFFVQDYSPTSLHALTPVPEAVARAKARFYRPTNAAALLSAGASPAAGLEIDEKGFLGETPRTPTIGSPAWELERERERQDAERERMEEETAARRAATPAPAASPPPEIVTPSPVSPPPSDDIPF